MVKSFAHQRGWWWYLAVLPPMLLPWVVWPPLWRAARGWRRMGSDVGIRFCLAWFGPAFLAFSLISGKQLHYLLPVFPALALVLARLVATAEPRRLDSWIPGLLVAGVALAAMTIVPLVVGDARALDSGWLALPVAAGLVFPVLRGIGRPLAVAGLGVVLVAALYLVARPEMARAYDLRPLALQLSRWEALGHPLAHYGKYHGQFHFLGRLKTRMTVVGDGQIDAWVAANPTGKVVTYQRRLPGGIPPDFSQPFRNKVVSAWDSAKIAGDRSLVLRR